MVRPKSLPDTFLSRIMSNYCNSDVAYNCLPSLHVATSWVIAKNIYDNESKKYGIISLLLAVVISMSTVFVRQHYLLDIPAGIILALVSYALSKKLIKGKETIHIPISRGIIRITVILLLITIQVIKNEFTKIFCP